MSWNTIAEADVLNEFTPVEQVTLAGLQASDSLPGILTNVVNAARGNIVAGGNQLGPAGTIPDQLRSEVIAIARWKWLMAFPQIKSMQTEGRKNAAKEAQDLLNLVASNKADRPRVEIPDTGTAIATKSPVGAVGLVRPGQKLDTHGYGKIGST